MKSLFQELTKGFSRSSCLLIVLSLLALSQMACPGADAIKLFVVTEEKITGGQYIDTPEFPKLGYISRVPDLVITRLADFRTNSSPRISIMMDETGQATVQTNKARPELIVTLFPEETSQFAFLTEKSTGKRILCTFNDTLLNAPKVMSVIATPDFSLGLCEQLPDPDREQIQNRLMKMVQKGAKVPPPDAELARLLIGTWVTDAADKGKTIRTVTYNADGTGTESVGMRDQPESSSVQVSIRWAIRGAILCVLYEKSSDTQKIPIGLELEDRIVLISAERFVSQAYSGYDEGLDKLGVKVRKKK